MAIIESNGTSNELTLDIAPGPVAQFYATDCINTINGQVGATVLKFTNTSATSAAFVEITPTNTVYTFDGVLTDAGTATFNVTAFLSDLGTEYSVTLATPGDAYAVNDELVIIGTDLGGTSPANDITITVTAVTATDGISTFTYTGSAVWPQQTGVTTCIAPNETLYVKYSATPTGYDIYGNAVADTTTVYVQAVTVVG